MTPSQASHYTLHGLKATVLSWARQLDVREDLRGDQGHHRASSGRTAVALYSRDDVWGALRCQDAVLNAVHAGFRPLAPQGRGGQIPLAETPVVISGSYFSPKCLQLLHKSEAISADASKAVEPKGGDDSDVSNPSSATESEILSDHEESKGGEDSEASGSSSDTVSEIPCDHEEEGIVSAEYICNASSMVCHIAKSWSPSLKPDRCIEIDGTRWAKACGTIAGGMADRYFISEFEPEGYELCKRPGCMINWKRCRIEDNIGSYER